MSKTSLALPLALVTVAFGFTIAHVITPQVEVSPDSPTVIATETPTSEDSRNVEPTDTPEAPVSNPVEPQATTSTLPGKTQDAAPTGTDPLGQDVTETPVCEEDEPCWDWRTMGNRQAAGTLVLPEGEALDVLVTFNEDGSYSVTTH